jgi:hypothetical protein
VDGGSFVGPLNTVAQVARTVPANGDVNPYGVAIVPESRGKLTEGDVLVSNFNNATPAPGGQQGRATTLVEISPGGHQRLFAQIPANSVPGSGASGTGAGPGAGRPGSPFSLPRSDYSGVSIIFRSSGQE